jgi:hypothetical protein
MSKKLVRPSKSELILLDKMIELEEALGKKLNFDDFLTMILFFDTDDTHKLALLTTVEKKDEEQK